MDAPSSAPDKGNSRGNTATLTGGTVNRLTGGYTDANGGKATANNVFIEGGTVNGDVRGGNADGSLGTGNDATGNTVTVTGGTVNGALYGGYSANGKSTGNTVTLGDGRNALASAALSNADLYGGNDADKTDNILNVKTNVTVKSVQNFSKINFENNASVNAANPMLKVTGGANTTFDSLSKISADENLLGERTLVENLSGITIADGKNQYGISKEKTEHLLENNGTQLRSLGYQFKGAEVTHNANVTGDLYGGRSELGNSTVGNRLTITGGAITGSVHGGYTKTPGTEAGSDKGDSRQNTVTLKNGTVSASVFGGYVFGGTGQVTGNKVRIQGGAVTGFVVGGQNDGTGSAKDNEVTVEGGSVHEIIGGLASSGDASENTVDLGAVSVNGNVTGGKSSGAGKTNNNTIHLRGTTVSGIVRGGSNANGTGNTLVVHSRAGGSTIGDFSGIQNLHFYVENDAVSATSPMLRLSGVNAKNITGIGIGVGVSGAAKVLAVGESIRLLQTASGPGLTTDAAIQNQITGDHGSSVRYKFDIKKAPGDPTALIATVKEKEMKEQTKSYVETRAALTDFVNHGGDILAGESLSSAKRAAKSAQGNADMERYQVWAGMGGSALRAESGSHVDTNGWNLHVGWARQDTTKSGQTLFSPFVEYGRGSYDSYVDDNAHTTVHGSGTVSYFGLGLLARAERKGGLWYEGSIRGGRATSDYQSRLDSKDITYDGSNPYYAAHLGLGKDIKVKGEDTVTPYLRYFYTHQNGMTATLSGGEVYDFGSVNSHRVRLGFQYTHNLSTANAFYAGLAYEYEFNGEITATFQGYSTPSPSLKGSSGMLELGYRFAPTDGALSYDLHFTGWQGIRRGFSGGAQITWGF